MRVRLALTSILSLLLVACATEPAAEGGEETTDTGGGEAGVVTLVVETDPAPICAEISGAGEIQLEARRVDCWDPQLPCTLPQTPPWVAGSVIDCGSADPGGSRFEVEIQQTGRWQARIVGGEAWCFGLDGESRTNVGIADLDAGREFVLDAAPFGECGEP